MHIDEYKLANKLFISSKLELLRSDQQVRVESKGNNNPRPLKVTKRKFSRVEGGKKSRLAVPLISHSCKS